VPGRRACTISNRHQPSGSGPHAPAGADRPLSINGIPDHLRRSAPPNLPEVSELDLVRHFTNLSRKNWSIDVGPYPLGSCTMKYNPKIHEEVAALPGFRRLHPWQPAGQCQGALELLYEMQSYLCEITGMSAATFQPAAGAAGEMTGLLIIRAYHKARDEQRDVVLVPDSAHGTNPATVTRAGFVSRQIPSDPRGLIDLKALEASLNDKVAGLMLTNPNTLGLFESDIEQIARLVHRAGGLLYYDGANLNAIMGMVRPGDMGFDVVHVNLHKTFTTPHGGGGPGAGPVLVSEKLEPFLPSPVVGRDEKTGRFFWDHDRPQSAGRVHGFHGNFAVVVRAYAYIRSLGPEGLRRVSQMAVLNANYLRQRIQSHYPMAHPGLCMHEFVATAKKFKANGVRAVDIAKRLIDLGIHPPTVYFPMVVEEALMVEPTETESKQTLDSIAEALLQIAGEAQNNPELLHQAPVSTPVGRLDEARAARRPQLRWTSSPD